MGKCKLQILHTSLVLIPISSSDTGGESKEVSIIPNPTSFSSTPQISETTMASLESSVVSSSEMSDSSAIPIPSFSDHLWKKQAEEFSSTLIQLQSKIGDLEDQMGKLRKENLALRSLLETKYAELFRKHFFSIFFIHPSP